MEIHFEIINQCLLSCRHCSSMASKLKLEKEYSKQDMIKLLKAIKGEKEVFLTGGEPLLYTNLDGMLNDLQTQITDISLGIFTTGIISDSGQAKPISQKYAEKLAECGLKVCYLSVYSHLEQEHDWMTRLQGSYKMIKESISHLRAVGIEIRFNSVVTNRNMSSFNKIIEFAESIGATEVRILKLIRQGRAKECWEDIGVTEQNYKNVIQNAMKRRNKLRITASGAIDILPCRHGCNIQTCPAGKWLIYVTNNGDIFPCASVKRKVEYKIGNISEMDIVKNWNLFQTKLDGKILCK
ncbi:radical SAM protein [Lachnoclostridium sp. An76]|uniref:radical SAM protein n=1 Tax=Lachnoclostridium sp. An76 TaxID=1965654 RepID=UPI000B37C82E|nr:radical SAM protein [Lachnoclostridium sp. An76]OUN33264.1 hypothetical protein B5G27_12865 [Lachnoclostridium sp. An76]